MDCHFPSEFTDKYNCFSKNSIFIIPHDLYCYDYDDILSSNLKENKERDSSVSSNRSTNHTSFENLKFMTVLTDNWKNRIKKTISSSKAKILKKLGIKQ
jgi:hypothetical protein